MEGAEPLAAQEAVPGLQNLGGGYLQTQAVGLTTPVFLHHYYMAILKKSPTSNG